MGVVSGNGQSWATLLALILGLACGRVERAEDPGVGRTGVGPDVTPVAPGGAAGSLAAGEAAGALAVGGAPAAAGVSAGAGMDASAGAPRDVTTPPANVAGRWALFMFEDPVGVNLVQDGDRLTGEGCAGGTPPLQTAGTEEFCGAIVGRVMGQSVEFDFAISMLGFSYHATTQVSADGRRMTGGLYTRFEIDLPTAWLRVPDASPGLPLVPGGRDAVLSGAYQLDLEGAETGGTEYTADKSYRFNYWSDRGIASDLGSFWNTEIGLIGPPDLSDHDISVGPVSATAPELAVSMVLETDASGVTRVYANTASRQHYEFRATRLSSF